MSAIRSHRDLLVWQKAMSLAQEIYEATRRFPKEEMFGLTSQTRRAAVSIAANIAEGYGRGTRASYVNFLRVARGSLLELETHIELAGRIEMVHASEATDLLDKTDELGRMLHGLIAKISKA